MLRWISSVLAAAVLTCGCSSDAPPPHVVVPAVPAGVDDLNTFLEDVRARHALPGIVAAVFDKDGLRAVGAAGTRKVGSGVPIIHTDRLQIASIAKTITATIVATLIDRGRLSWTTTLGEIYPEYASTMLPVFRDVTVDDLLRHRAGLPRWMRNDDMVKSWVRQYPRASNRERRHEAVKYILAHPPEFPPRTREAYTNDAYLILGNICEQITNRAFEDLVGDDVQSPLGLPSLIFEEPSSDRSLDQPWGHVQQGERFVPYDPDPRGYDGVPFATPYGAGVSMSVVDVATYGRFHLRGDLGLEGALKSETFRRLHHTPPSDLPPAMQVAAAGFFNEGRADADGRWINVQHWGYYARGRTLLWFSPQANVGAVVLTNGTDEDEVKGMQPISEIVIALFKRYRNPPTPRIR